MHLTKTVVFIALLIYMGVPGHLQAEERKFCNLDTEILGSDTGWELAKDKNNIKVYLRETDLSPVKVFRTVTELEVDFHRLVAMVWDGESYPDWLYLVNEVEILAEVSDTQQYTYTIHNAMWPVKKRDYISLRQIYQDQKTLAVTVETCLAKDYMPKKKGLVRIPFIYCYGTMTPIGNGKVKLLYEVLVDAGGWLPKWVIEFYQPIVGYITFRNIQKKLPLEKYKDVRFDFLKYPDEGA
jgi:hypothetical protein